MATFGCHNCGVNLKDWEDKPYETWPCASCALSKDYSQTFSTGFFDTGALEEVEYETGDGVPAFPCEHEFVTAGDFPLKEEELQSLETIQAATARQICSMFSNLLVRLLHMAKKNPVMFEVFIKKMQFPHMSYSEIGDTMDPRCSKQNVLYHLKNVVEEFPELETVIQTDTRYSAGRYALRTIADKRRRDNALEKTQKLLFREYHCVLGSADIKTLNFILRLPFLMRDEVFTFNSYLKDEEYLHGRETENQDRSGDVQVEGSENRPVAHRAAVC